MNRGARRKRGRRLRGRNSTVETPTGPTRYDVQRPTPTTYVSIVRRRARDWRRYGVRVVDYGLFEPGAVSAQPLPARVGS